MLSEQQREQGLTPLHFEKRVSLVLTVSHHLLFSDALLTSSDDSDRKPCTHASAHSLGILDQTVV
jgi:hypothetical protein